MSLFKLFRPLVFALSPEDAHRLTIRLLKLGLVPPVTSPEEPRLHSRVAGLDFPNPIGLAGGFDKHAEVPDAMLALGFGFVEADANLGQPAIQEVR